MVSSTDTQQGRHYSREVRDLRQQGLTALTWGLPNPVTEATVVGLAILMREKLADKGRADGASAATEIASLVLDKSMSKMPGAGSIACAKGCNFCCHAVVSVSAPEVFRMVRGINDRDGVLQRTKRREGMPLDMLLASKMACPLLVDGDCSVHEERPMGCRQYVSASVEACKELFDGKRVEPPFLPAAANVGLIARSLLLAAAQSLTLRTDTYELSSALAIALSEPDGETRWLAGENVLARAMSMPQPPNMTSSVQRWSGMLNGLLAG